MNWTLHCAPILLAVALFTARELQANVVSYDFQFQVTNSIGPLFGLDAPALGDVLTGQLTYFATAAPTGSGTWTDALGATSRLSIRFNGHTISTVPGELDAFNEFGWVEFGSAEGGDFPEGLLLDGASATDDGYLFLALSRISVPENTLDFPLDPLSQWHSGSVNPMIALADNVGGGYVEGRITSLTPTPVPAGVPEPSAGFLAILGCWITLLGLVCRGAKRTGLVSRAPSAPPHP